jgi:hypothetical protein
MSRLGVQVLSLAPLKKLGRINMETKVRTAFLLRFKDGTYLGHHKKPGAAPSSKWLHGRKVDFMRAKIYPTKGSVSGAKKFIFEPVEVVEIYISEALQMVAPKVLESV